MPKVWNNASCCPVNYVTKNVSTFVLNNFSVLRLLSKLTILLHFFEKWFVHIVVRNALVFVKHFSPWLFPFYLNWKETIILSSVTDHGLQHQCTLHVSLFASTGQNNLESSPGPAGYSPPYWNFTHLRVNYMTCTRRMVRYCLVVQRAQTSLPKSSKSFSSWGWLWFIIKDVLLYSSEIVTPLVT